MIFNPLSTDSTSAVGLRFSNCFRYPVPAAMRTGPRIFSYRSPSLLNCPLAQSSETPSCAPLRFSLLISETKDDMIEKPTLTSREGRWHHLIPSLLKYRPRILRPGNHPHSHDIVSEAQTPIPILFLALFLASSPSPEDSPLK